jgi:hypothetical protein
VCEPELQKQIALELEHKDLENQLLKKQIDLLEKSQAEKCSHRDIVKCSSGNSGTDGGGNVDGGR